MNKEAGQEFCPRAFTVPRYDLSRILAVTNRGWILLTVLCQLIR